MLLFIAHLFSVFSVEDVTAQESLSRAPVVYQEVYIQTRGCTGKAVSVYSAFLLALKHALAILLK